MYEPRDITEAFSLPMKRLHSLDLKKAKLLWQNSCVPNLYKIYFWMPLMNHTRKERTADPRANNQSSFLL